MKVGIWFIGTNKYKEFFKQFYDSFEKYAFPNHEKIYFYLTDDLTQNVPSNVKCFLIPSEPWPKGTLYRYKYLLTYKQDIENYNLDYLCYSDIDMRAVGNFEDDLFGEYLTGVLHPGFYKISNGTPEKNPKSKACIFKHEKRDGYICGGIQLGKVNDYFEAALTIHNWIMEDERNNITAIHNDESHWNRYYVSNQNKFKLCSPSYCIPECKLKYPNMPNYPTLKGLKVYLLALDKNHNYYRS